MASDDDAPYLDSIFGTGRWVQHLCTMNGEPPEMVAHSKMFHRNGSGQLVARKEADRGE